MYIPPSGNCCSLYLKGRMRQRLSLVVSVLLSHIPTVNSIGRRVRLSQSVKGPQKTSFSCYSGIPFKGRKQFWKAVEQCQQTRVVALCHLAFTCCPVSPCLHLFVCLRNLLISLDCIGKTRSLNLIPKTSSMTVILPPGCSCV